ILAALIPDWLVVDHYAREARWEEALAPQVRKADSDSQPILFLVVSKPGWSRLQLSDYADRNLVDRFSAIDGVARVFLAGEARPSMRVWMKPERL
ncbi:MAG: efflux RND transporter permease subunit, partial [Rhodospirillaceae bacterium]|nr:efflux RND transporter permease subunit [Rhodospirillaceae bacterium]